MTKTKSHQAKVPNQVKDHMVSGNVFSLVWEPGVRAYKTEPVPQDLSAYYHHEDYISHQEDTPGFIAMVYRFVRNYNIKLKLSWLKSAQPPGNNLLDYGSGMGDFLSAAQNKFWNAQGIEVNESARSFAQKKGLTVYKNTQENAVGRYDVITLWHVLEHLEDPVAMSQWFKARLSDQGVLVVAVPNHRSWDAKFYQEYWAAYDVPRHLWHFSKESLEAIFAKDFEIIQTHPMWFDAIYVSLLSERYLKTKGSGARGILVGIWSNLNAIFSKEASSIAYVLKKRK